MRNIPPRILVLSALFTALASATAIVPVVAPAMAQPSDGASYRAEFERIKQEMKELWLEMHNFHPESRYCLPPLEPPKLPHVTLMQVFGARTQALVARYNATKRSLQDFLAGNHRLAAEMMVDDIDPRERRYWQNSPFEQETNRLVKKFNQKDAELKARPERNCAPPPPKKEIEVIGGNPPVQPPPPPPPPPPPVDPLAGLTRPSFEAVNIPRIADRYCSQQEKDAALAKIPPEIFKVLAQIEDIDIYIAAVQARRAELEKRGVEAHWLSSMDYEVRQAEGLIADRRTTIEALKTTRGLIESTPVVDCSTDKKIGALPDVSTGIEAAYGNLTIPKKPYLSLEIGGNQYLGVVDHTRVETIAAILLSLTHEFDCDRMPNFRIGDPRRQRWMTVAELFGHDYSVFSNGGAINTTTEGVGIPGTGDAAATYPAGVFMANPATNDVTNIDYRHRSELDGVTLGLGQKSYYNGWSSTLGIGVSYARLETSDTLSGTIQAFPFDFRYATDVETRNFGLFVKGGAEIAVDDMWDTALRYAGEFSGFRLAVEAKAGVNFLEAEGVDRLDLTGAVADAQRIAVAKDDATFGYHLGLSLKYVPPGVEALEISVGARYGESDTHPVAHRSGQTGETTRIEFETQEELVGTLRTKFNF